MTIKKILATGFLLGFLFLLSPQPIRAEAAEASALGFVAAAGAGIPVTDVGNSVWQTVSSYIQKIGSFAFQKTLTSTLNKIAYDAAMYIGSGGEGQGPLFNRMSIGDYFAQIGDEAAGEFIEAFVNDNFFSKDNNCSDDLQTCNDGCADGDTNCLQNCSKRATDCNARASKNNRYTPSINVCSPSSLGVRLKIGLGLVEQQRPGAPNCTATRMIQNWENDINQKIEDLRDPNFLSNFGSYFDPRSNDLGITVSAYIGMNTVMQEKAKLAETDYTTNKGWLDVRNIAGELEGTPGNAEKMLDNANASNREALGKTTGDILVDAANIFLNQLALTAFQNLLSSLGDRADRAMSSGRSGVKTESDPRAVYGETALNEIIRSALQPKFNTIADYNILAQLAICSDNKNPGPDNCVIDSQFVQAISEQKTVAEAIKAGYLHANWQITNDVAGDSYNSSYSLRNLSILRKYRILPVGWEEAALLVSGLKNQAPKKATLMDLISCFDENDGYKDFSTGFDTSDQGWCEGLVDPNWLLKAPLNYCKRSGIGPNIISKSVIPGSGTGLNIIPSSLSIIRSDGYCADNQSCIKENKDGSCEAYGYCNEEKRTWKFEAETCEPIYNTCQSFVSESGQTASYLQNTLDYGECDADNSGCRRYSVSGNYATSSGQVTWNGEDDLYLNKNLGSCDSKDEGCTELLRVKSTWGANLVMNANFASDEVGASSTNSIILNDWPLTNHVEKAEIVRAELDPGVDSGKAIKLKIGGQQAGGISSSNSRSLLPDNFQILPGQSYTLSAEVYAAPNTPVSLVIGNDASWGFVATSTGSNSWQQLTITRPANTFYNEADFQILAEARGGDPVTFYVKNIKFEIGNWSNSFSAYGTYRIYQKLIPSYLEKICYEDASSATKNYNLKNNAPAVCYKFARQCNKNEVGCELFTAKTDNFAVAAQVSSEDYCASECVGYDAYVARASHFSLASEERMIPAKAKICSAQAAGCTEFTNLDRVGQGGEGREYYSELKHCIKPSQGTCRDFYTWEGQGAGYQLKAYSLEADSNRPRVLSGGSTCNAAVYNLPVNSPQYNSDCQEFYNTSGDGFYALLSKTVTCSEGCNTYRMNNKNINKTKTTVGQCIGASFGWDNNVCYECLNEGIWDTTNKACLYQAIPGEGKVCAASENGCREYNGNYGNNIRLLTYYDFENGLGDWTSNCSDGIATSTISSNKNGHSLSYNSGAINCGGGSITRAPRRLIEEIIAGEAQKAQLDVSGQVTYGKAYTIKFMAKADTNTTLNLKFLNSAGQEAVLTSVIVKAGAWNLYQTNLESLDHDISGKEQLIITANGNFFLDNFILSEITDRYYLIKNSSQVPDICYYDIFNKYRGADYNLGCSSYDDRAGITHNLHRFSGLCSGSAVGCEQIISTANSSDYQQSISNDANSNGICDLNEVDCALVPRDRAFYVIYDETKLCAASNKGCSRLGEGQGGAALLGWSDVFKKNDPDQYERTMCNLSSLGCEAWKNNTDGGFSYFKNPGFNACVYRASQNPTVSGKNWYKIPAKRCDLNSDNKISGTESNGSVCLNDGMCGNKKCLIDNNDYLCSVSYLKTIGFGGAGNQIATPDKEAGLCEASASGCTEYIDMVSRFSLNVVKNPSHKAGQNTPNIFPGWSSGSNPEQVVALKPYKLYSLYVKGTSPAASLSNFNDNNGLVRSWLSDNSFSSLPSSNLIATTTKPIIFNSLNNNKATLLGGKEGINIELKELIIDYRIKNKVDKTSCNGLVNFDNGCILFNERSVAGASGLANLNSAWDAYASVDGAAPVNCDGGSCTANTLIKVRPDRTCNKWLDCVTYIQDPETNQKTCYAYGECDRLNDKNECANFLEIATGTQEFIAQNNKNTSGFAVLGKYSLANAKEVGSSVNNGNFDFEGATALTCQATQQSNSTVPCPNDLIINEPDGAPVDYPAHGQAYLKVPGEYRISPNGGSPIAVEKNTDYFINYLVNTRGSSHDAKIEIVGNSGLVTSNVSRANNGWERKIFKFNSGSSTQIRLYLLPNVQVNAGGSALATPIYFDDLNIEPVLKIGENQYAARECRLYPTANSLSCFNKNENIFTNGLEGYCLERDVTNPANCLLWHPLDKLASSRSSQSTLGYQGQSPLNYCTEVDGNFDLVEKREAYSPKSDSFESPGNCGDGNKIRVITGDNNGAMYCDPEKQYRLIQTRYQDSATCFVVNWCVPIREDEIIKVNFWGDQVQAQKQEVSLGTSSAITRIFLEEMDDKKNKITGCVREGFCSYMDYEESNSKGWYQYNGLWEKEKTNASPAIRIFDHNNPVSDEKYLSLVSDESGVDEKNVYRLKCNEFTEVVDTFGNNYSWSGRVKSTLFGTSTPPFFKYDYPALNSYGRNRDNIPFGSAFWPDNFNLSMSSKVPLLNQYSISNGENIEEVYAGRPYGCRGESCNIIGYCSNNPRVYCLIGNDNISSLTCNISKVGGGTTQGECLPLMGTATSTPTFQLPAASETQKILKNIFLSGARYQFNATSSSGYLFNEGWNYALPPSSTQIKKCTSSVRPFNNLSASFCAIYPEIRNIKMYPGSSKLEVTAVSPNTLYRLEFNTEVDAEQQPLREIVINWGDGSTQIIPDQDHRPQNTHVFYHLYVQPKLAHLKVKITDNWGFYDEKIWPPTN